LVSHETASSSAECKNGSAETTVAEGGRNMVGGLWGHTLGDNWPPEQTSSYAVQPWWLTTYAASVSV